LYRHEQKFSKAICVTGDTIPPFEAVTIVIATFGLLLFGGAAFLVLFGYGPGSVLGELLVAVLPLGCLLARKIDVRSYVSAGIKPKTVLLGIAVGVALFFFDVFILNLLVAVFGTSQAVEESNKIVTDLAGSSLGLVSILIMPILAGVCEEFTFRGFLMNAIDRKYSFVPALLISSLAFGLFHFDPQFVYTIGAFLIGLMLGYVYHRWHSLAVSVAAHATVDLIAVAITLLIR
jgi:membrane protease YdiL (CAAX protease family)